MKLKVMGLSSVHLQAPGIRAMESGEPWTYRSSHPSQPPTRRLWRLESINEIFHVTTDLPPSPISSVHRASAADEEEWGRKSSRGEPSPQSLKQSATGQMSTMSLKVPDVAKPFSGGCFDTENWVFKIVWKHVQYMNIDELMSSFFHREDRGKYGENHTSTRGPPDFDDVEENARNKGKGTENHRQQEQERRVRHRCLQAESDECISTDTLQLALKELPKIKKTIHEMQKGTKSSAETPEGTANIKALNGNNATARKLGKDDQLTAVLMSQYVAFILISRLYESLVDRQHEIETLHEDVDHLQTSQLKKEQKSDEVDDPGYWRRRFEQAEADKKHLQEENAALQRQLDEANAIRRSSSMRLPQLLLPVPPTIFTEHAEDSRAVPGSPSLSSTTVIGEEREDHRPAKRPRHALEPPPPTRTNSRVSFRHGLPPSPASSFDGSLWSPPSACGPFSRY